MDIAFCHGQEHQSNHSHILLVTSKPEKLGLENLIDNIRLDKQYKINIRGKEVILWVINSSFDKPSIIRRLLRNLDLLIFDYSSNLDIWTPYTIDQPFEQVFLDFFDNAELNSQKNFWSSQNMINHIREWLLS